MRGVLVGLGFVFLQPCGLERVPLGDRRGGARAVVEACDGLRLVRAGRLLGGTNIHPHDGGAKRFALRVHCHHGERRGVVGDTCDFGRGNARKLNRLVARRLQRPPPIFRILLGVSGTWMRRLIGRRREGQRATFDVEDRDTAGLRAVINTEEVRGVGNHVSLL